MIKLPVIEHACGYSLRGAALLIGWLSVLCLEDGVFHSLHQIIKYSWMINNRGVEYNYLGWGAAVDRSIVRLVIAGVVFLLTVFMLIGVKKRKSKYMVLWVYGNIVGAAGLMFITFFLIWEEFRSYTFVLASISAIYSYVILVVYSYYMELENDRNGAVFKQAVNVTDDSPVKSKNFPCV